MWGRKSRNATQRSIHYNSLLDVSKMIVSCEPTNYDYYRRRSERFYFRFLLRVARIDRKIRWLACWLWKHRLFVVSRSSLVVSKFILTPQCRNLRQRPQRAFHDFVSLLFFGLGGFCSESLLSCLVRGTHKRELIVLLNVAFIINVIIRQHLNLRTMNVC